MQQTPGRYPTPGSHSRISRWLLTFDKQWLLVHSLATFACFALMFTGGALFVTTDFDNFDEAHPTWLGGAMVSYTNLITPTYT